MPYLQSNLSITNEPVLALAKVKNNHMQRIIDIKRLASTNCQPISKSFDSKKLELSINGFIFQLSKIIKKND